MLMGHLASVIVCDLHIKAIPIDEAEADALLVVDGDRIAGPAASGYRGRLDNPRVVE